MPVFYFGKDYVTDNKVQLPVYAVTFGAGIPVKRRSYYSNQFTTINVGFEVGKRGNNSSTLNESIFKMHVGLSLSDIWFIKRKYD